MIKTDIILVGLYYILTVFPSLYKNNAVFLLYLCFFFILFTPQEDACHPYNT